MVFSKLGSRLLTFFLSSKIAEKLAVHIYIPYTVYIYTHNLNVLILSTPSSPIQTCMCTAEPFLKSPRIQRNAQL